MMLQQLFVTLVGIMFSAFAGCSI